MKDGYFYFKSLNTKSVDKSFGYISFTFSEKHNLLYFQCSLEKEKVRNLSNNVHPMELYISPVSYITNTSVFMGKFYSFRGNRLFIDNSIPFSPLDYQDEDIFVIVTSGGRTILFSEIQKKPVIAEPINIKESDEYGIAFDPFNTTNDAYSWRLIEAFSPSLPSASINDILKLFNQINISHDYFAKIKSPYFSISADAFLKVAFSSLKISGHIVLGKYIDSSTKREFNIIGLPGVYFPYKNAKKRRYNSLTNTLNVYARWIYTINKPENSYKQNFNGYWLYYFNAESGNPVKPIMKM